MAETTGDDLAVEDGALYTALHRLEKRALLSPSGGSPKTIARRNTTSSRPPASANSSSLKSIDHARITELRRVELLANISQDIRYALHGLKRKPIFALAVITILAHGVGAHATM